MSFIERQNERIEALIGNAVILAGRLKETDRDIYEYTDDIVAFLMTQNYDPEEDGDDLFDQFLEWLSEAKGGM